MELKNQLPPLEPEKLDEVCDKIDEMIVLEGEKIETLRGLKRCMRTAQLAGMHPNELKGQVRLRYIEGTSSKFRPWVGAAIKIEFGGSDQSVVDRILDRAGVQTYKFPLLEVHKDLWPSDVREKYEAYRRKRRGAWGL